MRKHDYLSRDIQNAVRLANQNIDKFNEAVKKPATTITFDGHEYHFDKVLTPEQISRYIASREAQKTQAQVHAEVEGNA